MASVGGELCGGTVAEEEEIRGLVASICQQSSTPATRQAAEQRLLILQRDPKKWRFHLELLFRLDDNCVFFMSQGLQHFVWANWRVISQADKEFLVATILRLISHRGEQLSPYARSKVEQVLAGACALSGSLSSALSLVVEPGHPGAVIGLSVLRTVLEEALSNDKRLTPSHRELLLKEVQNVAIPSTALAHRICYDAVISASSDGPLLALSLSILKVIVSSLPIGPHLTADVLDVLCSLAGRAISIPEGGDASPGQSMQCAQHCSSAIAAVQVLSELMGKKYIPQDVSVGKSGLDVLVSLAAKVVGLLQKYKPVCNHVDNTEIILPLLEFVRTFVECHLERCTSADVRNATVEAVVFTFLDEFAAITFCFTDIELLLEAGLVWEALLNVEPIRPFVTHSETSMRAAMYLLRQSLCCNNEDLEIQCMDMAEEINLNLIADADIRRILDGISSISSGIAEGSEEAGCMGTSLLSVSTVVACNFVESQKFMDEIKQIVPSMLNELFKGLSAVTTVNPEKLSAQNMDIHFLISFLPLYETPSNTLEYLIGILLNMFEREFYKGGRTAVALVVKLCQLIGGIAYGCRKGGGNEKRPEVLSCSLKAILPLLQCLFSIISGTALEGVLFLKELQVALSVALLQCVTGLGSTNLSCPVVFNGVEAEMNVHLSREIEKNLRLNAAIPLEVTTLLYCTLSRISTDVSGSMTSAMNQMSSAVLSADGGVTTMAVWSSSQMHYLVQTCAAISAMTKQHTGANAATRGGLLSAFSGIGEMIPVLLRSACSGLLALLAGGSGVSTIEESQQLRSYCVVMTQLVHLNTSLMCVFGRKSFGKTGFMTLSMIAEIIATPINGREVKSVDAAIAALPTGEGIVLFKQILQLIVAMASTTSLMITERLKELQISHHILLVMIGELSNSVVCAEILAEILRAGWSLITFYWPRQSSLEASLALGNSGECSQNGVESLVPVFGSLMHLFAGCLSSGAIPPQDSVLAVEGLLKANREFRLFSAHWFQQQFVSSILESTINAILLGYLPGHLDKLQELLEMICAEAGASIVWPAFKAMSEKVAVSANCDSSVVTQLILDEEAIAMQRTNQQLLQGGSSTAIENADQTIRSVYSGMNGVLATLSSEMVRCKALNGFS